MLLLLSLLFDVRRTNSVSSFRFGGAGNRVVLLVELLSKELRPQREVAPHKVAGCAQVAPLEALRPKLLRRLEKSMYHFYCAPRRPVRMSRRTRAREREREAVAGDTRRS